MAREAGGEPTRSRAIDFTAFDLLYLVGRLAMRTAFEIQG